MRARFGPLRAQRVRPRTESRYRAAVAQFFGWMRACGLTIPAHTEQLDVMLMQYAEDLWEDGDSKTHLANTLCGLGFLVPSLGGGRLLGAWDMHRAWKKREPETRARPLTLKACQAIAGWMAQRGFPDVAVLMVMAWDTMLRTCELCELLAGDCSVVGGAVLLCLRGTKVGQRTGVNQEVAITDSWLIPRLLPVIRARAGMRLLRLSRFQLRRFFAEAVAACHLGRGYTLYSLRRGGATGLFLRHSSYDVVMDRGRWASLRAMRLYISTALESMADATEQAALATHLAQLATHLHNLPTSCRTGPCTEARPSAKSAR